MPPNVSSFILNPQRPPLTFSMPNEGPGKGDTVYPFKAKANRPLFPDEKRATREFCERTFGQGGRMPEPGNRWFGDAERGFYSFKTETDCIVFIVSMSG